MSQRINTIIQFLIITIWSILVSIVCHYCSGRNGPNVIPNADTVTVIRTETIAYRDLCPADSSVTSRVTVRLPVVHPSPPKGKGDTLRSRTEQAQPPDTALAADSATVSLPVTSKKYTGPDYTAYISGFQPRLDSIFIRRSTVTQTVTPPQRAARRWSFGLQAGYGITPKGFQPYLGIGASYNLFTK